MDTGFREEVLNVVLAELLDERGVVSAPESIKYGPGSSQRMMPDVFVSFRGLRTVLEGKVDDSPSAEQQAVSDAKTRLEQGIAHVAIAVLYPPELRSISSLPQLKKAMASTPLRFRTFTEATDGGWTAGDVTSLTSILHRVYQELASEDAVGEAVKLLGSSIEVVSRAICSIPSGPERVARILQVSLSADAESKGKFGKAARACTQIAALTLANAMIFQEELSEFRAEVSTLNNMLTYGNLAGAFVEHWGCITRDIDYVPIFKIARDVLRVLPASLELDSALRDMLGQVLEIVKRRTALRHDLAGRIYHRLLAEAKFLGTYYTSIPAATMLLKLALAPGAFSLDWSDLDAVGQFRVADLACGTGTLLMAAIQAIADNYVNASSEKGKRIRTSDLYRTLMEDVVWGYDVLLSAVHLTASTIGLLSPEVAFDKMHLYCLPLGGASRALGSIDFLSDSDLTINYSLLETAEGSKRVTGKGDIAETAHLPQLDLCVMNPPFTRSVGGNLLFGSLPENERTALQGVLAQKLRTGRVEASTTAGLGSVFVAVADTRVKKNGRLAVVLPRALASGVAWKKTRDLLSGAYAVEYVIVSHDPGRWNFSENTDLSEVLVIARSLKDASATNATRTLFINLWRNPTSLVEAISAAECIKRCVPVDVEDESQEGTCSLQIGDTKLGEAISIPCAHLRTMPVWYPQSFAQTELVRAVQRLLSGRVYVPGHGTTKASIPLCSLGSLAQLGPDCRDIHDGFSISSHPTPYPAFWSHSAEEVRTLRQKPNAYLSPLSKAKPGRHLRKPSLLWPKAGNVLIAERLRTNSQRLVATWVGERVLANVWWPVRLKGGLDDRAAKALVLWLNSTLGILPLWAYREETEGSWVKLKKPVLGKLPVLDVSRLTPSQLNEMAAGFEHLCDRELQPFPEMASDPVRHDIDAWISEALGLPDCSGLRLLLSQEPIVSSKRLG